MCTEDDNLPMQVRSGGSSPSSYHGGFQSGDNLSKGEYFHMVVKKDCRWPKHAIIEVKFLGRGSEEVDEIKRYVRECAQEWEEHTSITFKFLEDVNTQSSQGDIRISFEEAEGCKSVLGTNARNIPQHQSTMNLPPKALKDSERAKAYILHEFGHALGCLHEHNSPKANIPWNEESVYQHFWKEAGWTRQGVYRDVLQTYSTDVVFSSEFDPDSIMVYDIPSTLVQDNQNLSWKGTLSETDKRSIATAYS